jgi:alginate O-acetyltransferase complex protein AlgI
MPFSSIHFLFIFLPIILILYFVFNIRWWRNSILLLGSCLFFVWSDPTHLHVLIGSVLINYLFGILIENSQKEETITTRVLLVFALVVNLLILGFYKYLGFFNETIQSILNLKINLDVPAFPLGISFFTFSGISYIIDVYQGNEKAERNLLRFGSYIMMFPKLLQGPITRFGQVKNELLNKVFVREEFIQGVRRFIAGLAKKVIIADNHALIADKVFDVNFNSIGAGVAWYGLISYAIQIYFDFSGYSDMAIGVGQILGFKLPENFNYPYISRSITDFWRRWHITLTSWFRTYVFIPLEFSRKKEKFFRQQSNIVLVFLLTGLWHGANWNFIIWGLYFGLILAIEASWLGKILRKSPQFIQHAYSLLLILFGWILFRIIDISKWGSFLNSIIGRNGLSSVETFHSLNILMYIPLTLLAVVLCTPVLKTFENKVEGKGVYARFMLDLGYLLLFVLAIIFIVSNGFSPFVYAQF